MSAPELPFLSRWSRLKQREREAPAATRSRAAAEAPPSVPADAGLAGIDPARANPAGPAHPAPVLDDAPAAHVALRQPREPLPRNGAALHLPSLDSLTAGSDFRPFMQAGVDAATRNAALKALFTDPHFNVMDGLDVYIEDYGKTEAIPPAMLARLVRLHAGAPDDGVDDIAEDADRATVAVAEEPAVEEPAVEEPAVEEPAVEEPAVEEPAVAAQARSADPEPLSPPDDRIAGRPVTVRTSGGANDELVARAVSRVPPEETTE